MTSIVSIVPATRSAWLSTAAQCPYATLFHTPYWAESFAASSTDVLSILPKQILFSDGLSAVVPLLRKDYCKGLVNLWWSMPAHTYGGWLSVDPLTPAHARLLAGFLQLFSDIIWRTNPFDQLTPALRLPGAAADFTQVVELDDGYTAARARSHQSHRWAVRKAGRMGAEVSQAAGWNEWESYFLLYEQARKRWDENHALKRRRGFPCGLFREFFNLPPEYRTLWLVRNAQGSIIFGSLCFYWNRHAVSWNSAGNAATFSTLKPHNLVKDHIIRDALARGCRWFDCNPSGGFKGVADFKRHLGAREVRTDVVTACSLRRSIAERVAVALRLV